jgi:hypothetical protein
MKDLWHRRRFANPIRDYYDQRAAGKPKEQTTRKSTYRIALLAYLRTQRVSRTVGQIVILQSQSTLPDDQNFSNLLGSKVEYYQSFTVYVTAASRRTCDVGA